jgi:26S proteasome regulatory subunit N6
MSFEQAQQASGAEAVALYEAVLVDEAADHKHREASVLALAGLYSTLNQPDRLSALLETAKRLFAVLPKARTAKLVRTVIDHVAAVPGDTLALEEKLCVECIAWAENENRRYLRQRLQSRLAAIQLQQAKYEEAIRGIEILMREVKQLDDKQLLVELNLVESQIYHKVRGSCSFRLPA